MMVVLNVVGEYGPQSHRLPIYTVPYFDVRSTATGRKIYWVRSVADSNHLFSTRINRISRSVPDASDSNQPDAGSGFEPHQFRATLVFTS